MTNIFKDLPIGTRFSKENGKRVYIKASCPFDNRQFGGVYGKYNWVAIDDTQKVKTE